MLFTRGETWNNAREKCKELGAELVKIESAEENKFIKTTFLKTPASYWIGLSDQENEGEWKWLDDSLLRGQYSNWRLGNPDNFGNNENCGSIVFGLWNDRSCDAILGFICEKVSP